LLTLSDCLLQALFGLGQALLLLLNASLMLLQLRL